MACSVHAASQIVARDPIDDGRGVHVFGDLLLDYRHQVEVGGYRNQALANRSTETVFCSRGDMATFVVPRSCQGEIQVVLAVTDKADLPMTRYRRVVIDERA